MRTLLAVVCGAASLSAAPVPKEFKKPDDGKLLVGTWKADTLWVGGRPDTAITTHTFVFEPDGKCHTLYAKDARSDWTYTFDPKAAPKRMRWVSSAVGRGASFDCVYEVTGDSLKLGFITAQRPMPPKVEPGPDLTLYVMRRESAGK